MRILYRSDEISASYCKEKTAEREREKYLLCLFQFAVYSQFSFNFAENDKRLISFIQPEASFTF